MDLPDQKNTQAWAKWVSKQWKTKRGRLWLIAATVSVILTAVGYHCSQVSTLRSQKDNLGIRLKFEREQNDRDVAAFRHTNQLLVMENSRLQTLLDPIQRKAKNLYPELENAAAVAKLANDLDTVRVLALKDVFRRPSPEMEARVDKALGEFKARYADWQPAVRVEVESGSIARRRVAEGLGRMLQKHSLGAFASGLLSVGNAPEAPITLSFGANDDSYPKAFQQAISPLVSGEVALHRDTRMGTNALRLYLNGAPLFGPAGQAVFQ